MYNCYFYFENNDYSAISGPFKHERTRIKRYVIIKKYLVNEYGLYLEWHKGTNTFSMKLWKLNGHFHVMNHVASRNT
jgi:hypothetical protein